MCGRVVVTLNSDSIRQKCTYRNHLGNTASANWKSSQSEILHSVSYNIAPSMNIPVLVSECNDRILETMRWGLIPSQFQWEPRHFQYSTFNARKDRLMQSDSLFSKPFKMGKRCVILINGFYEWSNSGTAKQPYFISFENYLGNYNNQKEFNLTMIAGIYENGIANSQYDRISSVSIITVDSAPSLKSIHHRMPAILPNENSVSQWLDTESVSCKDAFNLLTPFDGLHYYKVNPDVGNVRNNDPQLLNEYIPIENKLKTKKSLSSSAQLMQNWLSGGSAKRMKTE